MMTTLVYGIFLVIHWTSVAGHVILTYPPARQYQLDFLDNIRTTGPCGMPKGPNGSYVTTLAAGSDLNVTWHLSYPHRGGYRLELISDDGTVLHQLAPALNASWTGLNDSTAQLQDITLPSGFLCDSCVLRLRRQAAEWFAGAAGYIFWSCADIRIVNVSSFTSDCSGHGNFANGKCECEKLYSGYNCEHKDECVDNADCGHGECIDIKSTVYPKKQCYCMAGWMGEGCNTASSIDTVVVSYDDYMYRQLQANQYDLYWKVLPELEEIDVVMRVKSSTWVALGWKPSTLTPQCQCFPVTSSSPLAACEPEPTSEPEAEGTSEPEAEGTSEPEATPETEVTPEVTSEAEAITPEPETTKMDYKYNGKLIGSFINANHNVSGEVFAVDDDTIRLINFVYDGTGPAAYFWIGFKSNASEVVDYTGVAIPDEVGRSGKLREYKTENITIDLPMGVNITDLKWISLWCDLFNVSFGHVNIPPGFVSPAAVEVGAFMNASYGVQGVVTIVDSKTFFIQNLHYDGLGPDAYFYVGSGSAPGVNGTKVPDENGRLEKLNVYSGNNITIRLPGDLNVFEIDWLSIYCVQNSVDFGHVIIPELPNVPPYVEAKTIADIVNGSVSTGIWTVKWSLNPSTDIISFELSANTTGWVGIGFSASKSMPESDIVVGWVNSGTTTVQDRYASAKSEPPVDVTENINDISGEETNGVTTIRFSRLRDTNDTADVAFTDDFCPYFIFAHGSSDTFEQHAAGGDARTVYREPVCIRVPAANPTAEIPAGNDPCNANLGTSEPEGETEATPESETEAETTPEGGAEGEATGGGTHAMDCTDIIIGTARGNLFRIHDYYTRDRSTPRFDSFYDGGNFSLTGAVGVEQGEWTIIRFRRKLVATEPQDHTIQNALMTVIYARGQELGAYVHSPASGLESCMASDLQFYKRDELKYHGHQSQRGSATLNFRAQPLANDACRGEYLDPPACVGTACSFKAAWVFNEDSDSVTFTISGTTTGWLGLGISSNQQMANTDLYVGYHDASRSVVTVTDRWISGYSTPPVDPTQNIMNITGTYNNGYLEYSFTRSRNTGDAADNQFSDTQCFFFIYGKGPLNTGGTDISYHNAITPTASPARICIASCAVARQTFSVGIIITNENFVPALNNPASSEFMTLKNKVELSMNAVLKNSITGYVNSYVTGFRSGSVLAVMDTYVDTNNLNTTGQEIKVAINNASTTNDTLLGDLRLDNNAQVTPTVPTSTAVGTISSRTWTVTWTFEALTDIVTFELKAATTGWVGIGFSDSPNMSESDIVVGWVENGNVTIQDRYASGRTTPTLDPEANIIDTSGEEIDGMTTIRFSRLRDTGDNVGDIAFTDTFCPYFIFAQSSNDTFGYHESRRVNLEPVCIHIPDCGEPPIIKYGVREFTNTTAGFQANYTCNTGFSMSGNSNIICKADGTWSPEPTCTIKDCGSPPYVFLGTSSQYMPASTAEITTTVQPPVTGHVNGSVSTGIWTVRWSLNPSTDIVSFELSANTTGWVGIGFSDTQSMPNSDIITGWVSGGIPNVRDRYASAKSTPEPDVTQSITDVSGHEADGVTTIMFSRPRNTGDNDDVAFTDELCPYFIFAHGASDSFVYHEPAEGRTVYGERVCIRAPAASTTVSNTISIGIWSVKWSLDILTDIVSFELTANTIGWVAIGFSDTRDMPKSDIVLGWVTNGHVTIEDRYAYNHSEPLVDANQHVTKTSGEERDGKTTIRFSRPRDTGDKGDIAFTDEFCPYFIFAASRSDSMSDTFGYHHTTRAVYGNRVCIRDPGTSVTNTTFGSNATYACINGYMISGDATITCQADGTWERAPMCELYNCNIPPVVVDSTRDFSTTTFGSTANYTCDIGFEISGNASISCQNTGTWETAPTCRVVPEFTQGFNVVLNIVNMAFEDGLNNVTSSKFLSLKENIENSMNVLLKKTVKGFITTIVTGFGAGSIVANTDIYVSTSDANKTGEEIKVAIKNAIIANDTLLRDLQFDANNIQVALSVPKYTALGIVSIDAWSVTWVLDGLTDIVSFELRAATTGWVGIGFSNSTNMPESDIIVGWVDNGTVTVQDRYALNKTAPKIDNSTDILNASSSGVELDGITTIRFSRLRDTRDIAEDIAFTDTFCPYFIFAQSPNDTFGYHESRQVNPERVCIRIPDCGAPPAVKDGIIEPTKTTSGSQANYMCNVGFDLSGDSSIICKADGNWSNSAPTCTIKDCGYPPNITHATVSQALITPTVTSVPVNGSLSTGGIWSLKWYFNPSTDVISFELSASTTGWVGIGFSETADMPSSDIIVGWVNGDGMPTIEDRYASATRSIPLLDSTQSITDTSGHETGGVTTIMFSRPRDTGDNDDVAFTDEFCPYFIFAHGSSDAFGFHTASMAHEERVCIRVPETPVTTTTFGSNATYTCIDGYYITGDQTIACQANGTWVPPPNCTIYDCHSPPVVVDSTRDFSTTTFGSTAKYTCGYGFNISGNSTISCQKDGNWTAVPTCTAVPDFAQAFSIVFNIDNMEFEDGLNDVTSSKFIDLKANIENKMNLLLKITVAGFVTTIVTGFQSGSIIVSMETYVNTININKTGQEIKDSIRNANGNESLLGQLQIDANSIQVAPTVPKYTVLGTISEDVWSVTWVLDGLTDVVSFELRTATTGWVGIGFSNSSTMVASDIVVGWVMDNGTVSVQDRYAPDRITPREDATPNINRISGDEKDGITTIRFSRLRDTGDNVDDIAFTDAFCPYFIFAESPNDIFGKHENRRIYSRGRVCIRISDCGEPPVIIDGYREFANTSSGFQVNYMCNSGFGMTGASSIICKADGTWSKSAPTCTIRDCGNPPNITFSTVYQPVIIPTDTPSVQPVTSLVNGSVSTGIWTVHWSFSPSTDIIYFELSATTTGWVGIGFSNSPNMDNSDIIVGWVNGDGPNVKDRYASSKSEPPVDVTESINNISGEESNGVTTIRFSRLRDTGDTAGDIAFTDDVCPYFIFAHGSTDTFGQHGGGDARKVYEEPVCIRAPAPTMVHTPVNVMDTVRSGIWSVTWSLDIITDIVSFEVTANTTGWVAIGFSDTPDMSASDIVLGWVANNVPVIQDRYAFNPSEPMIDANQHITNTSGEEIDGMITIRFSRPRDTGDKDGDIAFTDKFCPYFIFAGSDPDSSNPEHFGYHKTNKAVYGKRVCIRAVTTTTVGSNVTYACTNGYKMSGEPIITCKDDGKWEPAPTCTIYDCGRPPIIPKGIRDFSTTTFGSMAYYACDTGFSISGGSVISCQSNGTWEAAPSCTALPQSKQLFSVTLRIINIDFENGLNDVTSSTFIRLKVNIESRISALLSKIPGFLTVIVIQFRRGSVLVDMDVHINTGMTGDQAQQLINNTIKNAIMTSDTILRDLQIDPEIVKLRSGPTIKIVVPDCGRPPVIPDGNMDFSTTAFGSTARYTCNSGYTVTGNATISCRNNGTWEATPVCKGDTTTLPGYLIAIIVVAPLLFIALMITFGCSCYFFGKKSNKKELSSGSNTDDSNRDGYFNQVLVDSSPKETRAARALVPVSGQSGKIPRAIFQPEQFPRGYAPYGPSSNRNQLP